MYHASRAGTIEVIAGVMFSGKSEELIRRVRRALIARRRVQVGSPSRLSLPLVLSLSSPRLTGMTKERETSSSVMVLTQIQTHPPTGGFLLRLLA